MDMGEKSGAWGEGRGYESLEKRKRLKSGVCTSRVPSPLDSSSIDGAWHWLPQVEGHLRRSKMRAIPSNLTTVLDFTLTVRDQLDGVKNSWLCKLITTAQRELSCPTLHTSLDFFPWAEWPQSGSQKIMWHMKHFLQCQQKEKNWLFWNFV